MKRVRKWGGKAIRTLEKGNINCDHILNVIKNIVGSSYNCANS